MDSVLTASSLTPTCAKSVGPCQRDRDPMEDADSPSTRKRPRLDSGDRAYRSMSADPTGPVTPNAEDAQAPETAFTADLAPQRSSAAREYPSIARTPSKVTINVREPLEQNVVHQDSTRVTAVTREGDRETEQPDNHPPPSTIMESSSPKVISVTSSPSRSPEIEVAEVEDMNDDPGETKWKRLEDTTTPTSIQEAKEVQIVLLDQFPHTSGQSLKKTLNLIAGLLEKGDLGDGGIFDSLATWIESYLQTTEPLASHWWDMIQDEREFWDDLPSLIDALMHRSHLKPGNVRSLYQTFDVLDMQSFLQNFLVAYAFLSLRMARMDQQLINSPIEDTSLASELISERYLLTLSNLMNCNLSFWKYVVDAPHYDCKVTITAFVHRFVQQPEDGTTLMMSLSREILGRSQKVPGLINKSFIYVGMVYRLLQHYHALRQSLTDLDNELANLLVGIPSQGYELFLLVDSKFQEFIGKQVPALSIDISQGFVKNLSMLLRCCVSTDDHLLEKVTKQQTLPVHGLGKYECDHLVELAWKLHTLKKCITDGRMEIRVQGVETMQQELVSVHNRFINNSPAQRDHPIPQFLSDFMLNNKLVDYFVGVDSHPQLIQRCGNIIGFLIVTNRYTEAETDTIWRAVTNSPDSRFIEAILAMLPNIFGIASYPILLYYTHKLDELPISAFDGSILVYATSLLDMLRRTWRYEINNPKMDMPPFHLCIRLLRQVLADTSLDALRRRQIHHFATAELRWFLQHGPSDDDRRSIYQQCIQDISDRNDSATGSISAIDTLLMQNAEKEFSLVAREWDLGHLVIDEYCHKIKIERSRDTKPSALQETLDPRVSLIHNIIVFVPNAITTEVGRQLWDYAVGLEALNHQTREIAWMSWLSVIRKLSNRNCFIDQCVREHLPRLQPRLYTAGSLHFAQDVSHYHFRSAVTRSHDDVKQETTAEDLLWQMSLAAIPGTLERKAISMLVSLYLDSPENTRRTRAAIEAIHIDVVERCVRQLTSAASKLKSFNDGTSSGEDEPMVIVASEDEIQKQRLSFSRSLTILKEFLWGIRSRPKYSPQLQTQPQLVYEPREVKGDIVQIRYQAFGPGATGEMRTIDAGTLETMQELASHLKLLTGFAKFTLISGGQKLDLGSVYTRTIQELKLDQKGLLLVKKDLDGEAAAGLVSATGSGLRPIEVEILTHFHDLYPLLSMEERLAKEMLEFLLAFPPHSDIISLVTSESSTLDEMFPASAPFKVMYSVHALKQCLGMRTQGDPASTTLTVRGIRSFTEALRTLNLSIGPNGSELEITVAAHLAEALTQFLKDPSYFAGTASLLLNPPTILHRLQSFINDSLAVKGNIDADILATASFAAILKISLHVEDFWQAFKDANICTMLLRRLVLDDSNPQIRCRTAEHITAICTDLHLIATAPAQELPIYLWESIVPIIPYCLETEGGSQEFFGLSIMISRSLDNTYRNDLDLGQYVQSWSDVLLRHTHNEVVGCESVDSLVFGISTLLNWVFQCAQTLRKTLPTPHDFLIKIFHDYLFPLSLELDQEPCAEIQMPVLHTGTRQELYSIVLVLSNNPDRYHTLLILVKNLLSNADGPNGWSWGFAQTSEDSPYDQNWNIERSKTIRSPTGYPGIRNLSNTCYMNSLLTQLFMNVKFRGFMLGMNVADAAASQKLLLETQTMFGYMQETMLRAVDSQGIVDSLVTYENSFIDVSVQMDVDEFYNLLFDRWEGQILLAADKKTFRGFYGGQIVQQIKSKECPHISERLEPFSAIQCDIHGKATLIDSLNAYVSGETMEGDNKYSCTSCGCYVDAVKRACLKDIPDNLIFHLKRFDYDVMTGMRSKINDAFEFPHEIDMAPYHIDYQRDTNSTCVPDMFELVGILVHSGTAESGHYYSYIRERPPVLGDGYSWVEFNDMDVTKFEPNNIADQCFGGFSEATHYAHRFQKNWNAYMLFYERTQPQSSNENARASTLDIPAKCPLPFEIERQVISSNNQYLRNYCLYDSAHAFFARRLLEQLRDINHVICSEDHAIEKEAIWLSLNYLERVLSRSKDCLEFSKMLSSLIKVIGSCSTCCRLAIDWVKLQEHALRNLLLRCPVAKVRKEFASMIVIALKHLRRHQPQWYGFQNVNDGNYEASTEALRATGLFPHIVSRLSELWTALPLNSRGWDDYFGLLADLADLGRHETHMFLNNSFLRTCLEILTVEHSRTLRFRNDGHHYSQYCRLLDKGRKFSHKNLVEFLATLLESIDLGSESLSRTQERPFYVHGMQLTKREDDLIQMGTDMARGKNTCVFLEKVLSSASNVHAAQRIVKAMILAEPDLGMIEHVQKTIMNGVDIAPAYLAEPYLEAAITFCEASPYEENAQGMVRYIAGEVDTIGEYGGKEHLKFFAHARRLVSLRGGFRPGFFNRTVLRMVPQWAPALLHYPEEQVRNATVDLLKHLMFDHDIREMDDEEHADLIETAARDLQVACTRRCNGLVQLQKHVDSKIVEQITTVIRFCLDRYYAEEEDQRFIAEADNVLAALEILTISDVDEAVSETWNNASDDMPTDSEDEFLTNSP